MSDSVIREIVVSSSFKRAAAFLAASAALFGPTAASAHVKWFCAFDVAGQPDGLASVLCVDFELLVGLAAAALTFGVLFEATAWGRVLNVVIDRATLVLRRNSESLIRGTAGFFFISLWNAGDMILTPELKTPVGLVSWLQLLMAFSLLWRRTTWFCGLGIFALFGVAVWRYGVFHLVDYPIFLGIGVWFILMSFEIERIGALTALDVVRYAAAFTLMWASIEKWAYPEWTAPLLVAHPEMTMGLDPAFFMRSAGAVEFVLAFALAWTPLCRRIAAAILVVIFASAIGPFGKIDAVGHSMIIAALLAVIAEPSVRGMRVRVPRILMTPFAYAASLALFLAGYYGLHAAMYGTRLL